MSKNRLGDVVVFDRTELLAKRLLDWMRLPRRPRTWTTKWFGVGHFVPFMPGDEAEIEAAIARLIDENRVEVHPVLRFIALPSGHTKMCAGGPHE